MVVFACFAHLKAKLASSLDHRISDEKCTLDNAVGMMVVPIPVL
jgi:hypothetical protein